MSSVFWLKFFILISLIIGGIYCYFTYKLHRYKMNLSDDFQTAVKCNPELLNDESFKDLYNKFYNTMGD